MLGRGDIIAIACILLLFVLFATGVVALQCCFNECHRRRAQQAAAASSSWRSSARWVEDGGNQTRKAGADDPEAPPMRPLPPAKVHYAAAARSSSEDDAGVVDVECMVCLAGVEDGEEARFLPCCNHGFHAQCVDTWLASRSTCPLCRVTFATTTHVATPPPPASDRLAGRRSR